MVSFLEISFLFGWGMQRDARWRRVHLANLRIPTKTVTRQQNANGNPGLTRLSNKQTNQKQVCINCNYTTITHYDMYHSHTYTFFNKIIRHRQDEVRGGGLFPWSVFWSRCLGVVFHPVFLPQDAIFVGRRSSPPTNTRSPVPSTFLFLVILFLFGWGMRQDARLQRVQLAIVRRNKDRSNQRYLEHRFAVRNNTSYHPTWAIRTTKEDIPNLDSVWHIL